MSYVAVAVVTFLLTTFWVATAEEDIRQKYADAGYIVINKQAYRITPVEKAP